MAQKWQSSRLVMRMAISSRSSVRSSLTASAVAVLMSTSTSRSRASWAARWLLPPMALARSSMSCSSMRRWPPAVRVHGRKPGRRPAPDGDRRDAEAPRRLCHAQVHAAEPSGSCGGSQRDAVLPVRACKFQAGSDLQIGDFRRMGRDGSAERKGQVTGRRRAGQRRPVSPPAPSAQIAWGHVRPSPALPARPARLPPPVLGAHRRHLHLRGSGRARVPVRGDLPAARTCTRR